MEKEFVPYELAVKLKELGFDFEDNDILGFYSIKYGVTTHQQLTKNDGYNPAILYQQAFRWFREKHSLHANINSIGDSTQYGFIPNGKYSGTIDDVTIGKEMIATDTVCLIPVGDTYEEAELACLDKLLEIVEQKEK